MCGMASVGDGSTAGPAARQRRVAAVTGIAGAGFALAIASVTWGDAPHPAWAWLPVQLAGVSSILSGTLLWARRPANGTGRLLTLHGVCWYLGDLQLVDHPAAFAAGFCLFFLGHAVLGHLVVALPTGHLRHRRQRWLVVMLYATPLLTQALRYATEYPPQPQGWGDPSAAYSVWAPVGSIALSGLTVCVAGLLVRRWSTASRPARREYAPLWLTILGIGVTTVVGAAAAAVDADPVTQRYLVVAYVTGVAVVPFALTGGLLRVRLTRLRVAELVTRLAATTDPQQVRAALASALDDPGLRLWFPLPDGAGYVDPYARLVQPSDAAGRTATPVGDPRRPLAILVHDPALDTQRPLVEAVAAAARLALDNARLVAAQRHHRAELGAARAGAVAAADAERRRIQRDLHDGVQQKLLAISMLVRHAHERVSADPAAPPTAELASAAAYLPEVVRELRLLAEGLHPPILAERGLSAAAEAIAERSPLPLAVDVPAGRWSADVERAAYFVITEALANVYKHAAASRADVRVRQRAGRLLVEISDDGVGGADAAGGTGLRGLHDRVGALGGLLRVSSDMGAGTRVTAELPCAS